MIKYEISAASILQDFSRRKITNDFEHKVSQGTLKLWRLNNNLLAELHLGGGLQVRGTYIYINTTSPQDIANDVITDSKLTKTDIVMLGASEMGKIGGAAKTEAKAAASRENGKKGGRPPKNKGI